MRLRTQIKELNCICSKQLSKRYCHIPSEYQINANNPLHYLP